MNNKEEDPPFNFQTMDAMSWAQEFAKIRAQVMLERGQDIANDEGTMLAWFANSIMRGYDEGTRAGERYGFDKGLRAGERYGFDKGLRAGETKKMEWPTEDQIEERVARLHKAMRII